MIRCCKMKTTDTRKMTPYGLMMADAVLARTGPLPYTREELGLTDGDPTGTIMLERSKETLEDALKTMKGAPITIDHPTQFVDSRNARGVVVGAVSTEPYLDNQGMVRAELMLFDEAAIAKVNDGDHELSPGFDFVIDNMTDSAGNIDAMQVNHIAIVRRGRAGNSVRILDSLPPALNRQDYGDITMNDEVKEIVTKAVKDALSQKATDEAKGFDLDRLATHLTASVTDGVKGIVDEMVTKFDEAQAKSTAKSANDTAIDEAVKQAVDAERARFSTIAEVTHLIAEDKRDGLMDKSTEEVLRLAIGDAVPGTDAMSADVLAGVLKGIQSNKSVTDSKPSGVVKVKDAEPVKTGADIMGEIYAKRAQDRAGGK